MKSAASTMLVVFAVGVFSLTTSVVTHSAAFIKFDGVEGESQDKDHNDWTPIHSFSWGASRGISDMAAGSARSRVNIDDISVVKELDKSSPKLAEACVLGKELPRATVAMYGKNAREPYLVIELKDVLISSYQVGYEEENPEEPSSGKKIIILEDSNSARSSANDASRSSNSASSGAQSGESVPTENLSLNFEEIKVTYNLLDRTGTFVNQSFSFNYSVESASVLGPQ